MNPAERLFIERYISDPKRNLLRFSFLFMILGIVISVGILTAALNLFEGYERALKSVSARFFRPYQGLRGRGWIIAGFAG